MSLGRSLEKDFARSLPQRLELERRTLLFDHRRKILGGIVPAIKALNHAFDRVR